MAALASLPDPDTLNVFSYYDPNVDRMVPIVSNDNTHPRVIDDYVIDPSDWQPVNRGGLHFRTRLCSPVGSKTVEQVLGHNTRNLACFVCGQKGADCHGQVCIDIAKDRFQDEADHKLQIRKARWGFGVFALEAIPKDTMIGEYLGRLLPFHPGPRVESAYIFTITGRAECDAEKYGNITHFFNHNCNCNTDPIMTMYGRRAVVAFRTNREIAAGEEITIDYGAEYFTRHLPCECDAFDYPHTSEVYRRRVGPDGSVSLEGSRKSSLLQPSFRSVRRSIRRTGLRGPGELAWGPDRGGAAPAGVAAHRQRWRRRAARGVRSVGRSGGDPEYCSMGPSGHEVDTDIGVPQPRPTTRYYATKSLTIWGF